MSFSSYIICLSCIFSEYSIFNVIFLVVLRFSINELNAIVCSLLLELLLLLFGFISFTVVTLIYIKLSHLETINSQNITRLHSFKLNIIVFIITDYDKKMYFYLTK